jgi:hypothetical protein
MRLVQVHGMFRRWLKTEVSHFPFLVGFLEFRLIIKST